MTAGKAIGRRIAPRDGMAMALLLLLALFARLFVPEGWMPAIDGIGIIPCSGTGPEAMPGMSMAGMPPMNASHMSIPGEAYAAASTHDHQHQDGDKAEHSCVFSSLSAPLTAPDLPAAPPVLPVEVALFALAIGIVAIGRGLAAPPPPPTGPPSIA